MFLFIPKIKNNDIYQQKMKINFYRLKTTLMYVLLGPVLLLFGEGLFTVAIRGGQEYKFISPCIALYLGSVVPAIWFLGRIFRILFKPV